MAYYYYYMYVAHSFFACTLHVKLQYKSIDPKLITVNIKPAFYKIMCISVIIWVYCDAGHSVQIGSSLYGLTAYNRTLWSLVRIKEGVLGVKF